MRRDRDRSDTSLSAFRRDLPGTKPYFQRPHKTRLRPPRPDKQQDPFQATTTASASHPHKAMSPKAQRITNQRAGDRFSVTASTRRGPHKNNEISYDAL